MDLNLFFATSDSKTSGDVRWCKLERLVWSATPSVWFDWMRIPRTLETNSGFPVPIRCCCHFVSTNCSFFSSKPHLKKKLGLATTYPDPHGLEGYRLPFGAITCDGFSCRRGCLRDCTYKCNGLAANSAVARFPCWKDVQWSRLGWFPQRPNFVLWTKSLGNGLRVKSNLPDHGTVDLQINVLW